MSRGAFDGRYGGGRKLFLLIIGIAFGVGAYTAFKSGNMVVAIILALLALGAIFGG